MDKEKVIKKADALTFPVRERGATAMSSQHNNIHVVKAAIYTRKSSEEGLEQDFNSLDAQREACESYIKSQKHEGWVLVEKEYSDGGISGGTLNRPAVQELIEDIKNRTFLCRNRHGRLSFCQKWRSGYDCRL